jgi:hypothetical protein
MGDGVSKDATGCFGSVSSTQEGLEKLGFSPFEPQPTIAEQIEILKICVASRGSSYFSLSDEWQALERLTLKRLSALVAVTGTIEGEVEK